MSGELRHRGPDGHGVYVDPVDGECALGHQRLSIIDLASGTQPLSNEDGRVWVVFNGEIYNFLELRPELERAGHVFKTHSDTEVLVHLWEQYGTAMMSRLRGMFAFAIWDENKRTLFLARDCLGKKPLYYGEHAGLFRFGSELKAILADTDFPRTVDPQSVMSYLTFGYVPHPACILKGVKKLPPAHWLCIRNRKIEVERYWSPPARPDYAGTFDDACAELRELLREATRSRMIADVPLGGFLSGGIDSTVIVGLMAGLSSEPVKTFTIGFEEDRFNEAPFARRIAARYGTAHHELVVRPDALAVLPLLTDHFDEPFADSSAIPTYYVSKLAREHVIVALTGDGGDEMFGGYRRYRVGKLMRWMNALPAGGAVMRLMQSLMPGSIDRTTHLGRIKRILEADGDPIEAYFAQMTQFGAELGGLLDPSFCDLVDRGEPARWFRSLYGVSRDPSGADMQADIQSYLPCDILNKVDIASMAVSLECRSPLLDTRVVEFACRLPTEWRLAGFRGHKHILKTAMKDMLPAEVTQRRKTGFAVPLPEWFRGPLKPLLFDTLLDERARGRGYFNAAAVRQMIDEHIAGHRNHSAPLWALLMLELWHRRWMDNRP